MAQTRTTRKPSLKLCTQSTHETITKVAKATPSKVRRSKTSNKSPAALKKLEKLAENPAATSRICIGCKQDVQSYLFLGVNAKSLTDYKEKCYKCRRVDAISDWLKTHGKAGGLSVGSQCDHLNAQKAAMANFSGKLRNRGIEITKRDMDDAWNAVIQHPAIQEGLAQQSAFENTQQALSKSKEDSPRASEAEIVIKTPIVTPSKPRIRLILSTSPKASPAPKTKAKAQHTTRGARITKPKTPSMKRNSPGKLKNLDQLKDDKLYNVASPTGGPNDTELAMLSAAFHKASDDIEAVRTLARSRQQFIKDFIESLPFDHDLAKYYARDLSQAVAFASGENANWELLDRDDRDGVLALMCLAQDH